MGVVRILLPLPRAAAKWAPEKGGPLLGAALSYCVTPSWAGLPPPSPARRLAWAEEAVAVYRATADTDGLSRALALRAHALLLSGRFEEACGAADEATAAWDAHTGAGVVGVSAAVAAFLGDVRAQALAGLGRAEDAVPVARESVAAYRSLPAPDRRDRALGSLPGTLRTYGMLLATTGRREESVAVYEECAALLAAMSLRELAHVERVRPQVLAELVGVLRASGRYEDALGVGPEAREALRGPLAWTVPETVLPLRVRLLIDLARCHTATGDPAEARACAQAAVAEARKPHGAGELTSALDCLADVLGALGQTDKESIARRELAELRDG
ncbi:tetratricopeptide repeat protein [Streptomyces griseorubiginosus]|uniref:tetratricopeptide repeat protein n=1 Tax=Streptomyces griseorubiginosus TaxID=67304 RepID=UPI003665EAB2